MSTQLDSIRIACGGTPEIEFVELIARNADADVDTGTVPETIWPVGGAISLRTTAAIVELISGDAADDNVGTPGTGAWTVRVEGLDEDYLPISEDIELNGATAVAANNTVVTFHGHGLLAPTDFAF